MRETEKERRGKGDRDRDREKENVGVEQGDESKNGKEGEGWSGREG